MSFLYGAMFAGLAALSVPVVLHLIAKQRFSVQDLPTIRLLDAQRRTNVLAPRLVDRWQLLLRLLLVLLAVLAMARWYATWSPGPAAPRNVVLVLDASASMRIRLPAGSGATTAFELAKAHARSVIDGLAPGSRCGLVADGQAGPVDVVPTTDLAAVRAALDAAATIDGPGRGLVRSVADACALIHGRRTVASQVVVLSDLRASAFQARDRLALERIAATAGRLGASLDLVFVDAGAPGGNLAIVDAYVRGGEAKVGDDAHLVATLAAPGDEPRDVDLRLAVADRRDPRARTVTLQPGARTVVDLTARVNRSAQTLARVEIDGDAYGDDDARAIPLNVRDVRRVLVVDGGAEAGADPGLPARGQLDQLSGAAPAKPAAAPARGVGGATILRFALNPGRELGLPYGTGIETTLVAPEALAGQPLSAFELVVLYDVSSLGEQALEDLRGFVAQGRSLLIVASTGTSAVAFNRTLGVGSGGKPALAPAQLGNDEPLDPALGIGLSLGDQALLAPFQDPLQGDLSAVRLFALRQLRDPPPGLAVLVATSDGRPIAVESALGDGRVVMLTTGFELARGNLARTRVFPTFLWRLVDYLTGRLRSRPPDHIAALRPAVLDVSEPALSLVERLELTPAGAAADAAAIALDPAVDGSVLVPALPAGAYTIHRARAPAEQGPILGYSRYVTSHIDAAESAMERLPADQLAPLFGAGARLVPPAALAGLAPIGGELTPLLVVALALLYAIEAASGWISGVRRERLVAEAAA
jgi:hypothetical protein